jgi:Pyridoxamine 5'-phosphate oxidase
VYFKAFLNRIMGTHILYLVLCFLGLAASNVGQVQAKTESSSMTTAACPCDMTDWAPPELWKKAATARWMSHVIDWGVLSTHSLIKPGFPFGNPYSFVDGPCTNATGTPYFFGTFMDQSFQDLQKNASASFTLSEASVMSNACTASSYADKVCKVSTIPGKYAMGGDPESPLCARLTLLGKLALVTTGTDEWAMAQASFYQRHPQMQSWPSNHDWTIAKLIVEEAWLIDYFGGATILTANEYFSADVSVTVGPAAPMSKDGHMSKEGDR